MSRPRSVWLLLACCVLTVFPARGAVVAIPDEATWFASLDGVSEVDFEAFTGPVSSEYPGITFSAFNGGTPNSVAQFGHSGENSVFTVAPLEGGGGWAAALDQPARGFCLWTGDVEFNGTVIAFYDAASNLLGSFDLLDTGSGNGPFVYGFNGFLSDAADIVRVEVMVDPADAVWFDDIRFGRDEAAGIATGDGGRRRESWGRFKSRFDRR